MGTKRDDSAARSDSICSCFLGRVLGDAGLFELLFY